MPTILRRAIPVHEQERRLDAIVLQMVQREIELEVLAQRLVAMGHTLREIRDSIDRLKVSGRLEEILGESTPK